MVNFSDSDCPGPAHGVNVWLFVKVVAILTDVVQGGEYGRVISPSALVRHPAITLTDRVDGGGQYLMPRQDVLVVNSLTC